ncbi:MAG: hypothetical protein IGS03_13395 [Candidatus Sericytochromatia bacterium]|nr:hypothetical protein [Candidatus Sericytochromatia bacterium]
MNSSPEHAPDAPLSREALISAYMEHCLEQGQAPRSLEALAQTLGQPTQALKSHFKSLPALEAGVFEAFLSHSLALLEQTPEYASYSGSEKLLALYYTFFELLSANRAYVLLALPPDLRLLQQLPRLMGLQRAFTRHLASLLPDLDLPGPRWSGRDLLLAEGFWLQLLSLLVFWYRDDSPNFEQTDVFIEKSVAALLSSLRLQPGSALLDWGRFCATNVVSSLRKGPWA